MLPSACARPLPRPRAAISFTVALAASLMALGLPAAAHADGTRVHLERVGMEAMPRLKAYVTVTEPDGSFITGHKAADFKLFIDGKDIADGDKMVSFERAKEPIYIVAVVQLSPAMDKALPEVKKGLAQIADTLSKMPSARMGLIGYTNEVRRLAESGTASEIGGAISKLKIEEDAPPEVHMLDALRTALDILRGQDKGKRKMVILFSDGIDEKGDKKAFAEMGEKAQKDGIAINTVGYAPFEPGRLKSLIELSQAASGIARGCKSPAEIGGRFEAVVDEILRQYVVFFPPMGGDGKEHVLKVQLDKGKGVSSGPVTRTLPVVEGQKAMKAAGGCSWF
jgi:hypothetical protein